MSQNNPPHGLEFLVGITVICALATARNFDRLSNFMEHIAYAIGFFLLAVLKVLAIGALIFGVCYGIYKLALWTKRFVLLVREIDWRTKRMIEEEVPDLRNWDYSLRGRISSVEIELGELKEKFQALELEAKKAKESPAASVEAVVSEIKRGQQ